MGYVKLQSCSPARGKCERYKRLLRDKLKDAGDMLQWAWMGVPLADQEGTGGDSLDWKAGGLDCVGVRYHPIDGMAGKRGMAIRVIVEMAGKSEMMRVAGRGHAKFVCSYMKSKSRIVIG